MSITAAKPVTKSEYDERMALARSYSPHAVANLAAEFRRRYAVDAPTEAGFESVNLQKCGLEGAIGGVESADLEKRLGKRRSSPELDKLKRRIASHDGPPTKEEIAEYLQLTNGPLEKMRVPIDLSPSASHEGDLARLGAQFNKLEEQIEKTPLLKEMLDNGTAEIHLHDGQLVIQMREGRAIPRSASGASAEKVAKSYTPTPAQILQHDGVCADSCGL